MSLILLVTPKNSAYSFITARRDLFIQFGLDQYENFTFQKPKHVLAEFFCLEKEWLILKTSLQLQTSKNLELQRVRKGEKLIFDNYELLILKNSCDFEILNPQEYRNQSAAHKIELILGVGSFAKITNIPLNTWVSLGTYAYCDIKIPLCDKRFIIRFKVQDYLVYIQTGETSLIYESETYSKSFSLQSKEEMSFRLKKYRAHFLIKQTFRHD